MKQIKGKHDKTNSPKKPGERKIKKTNPLLRLMDSPWPRDEKHRVVRQLWNIGLLLIAAVVMEGISLAITAEIVPGLLGSYFASPAVLGLNLLPLLLLAAALYALTGMVSLSAGLPGVLLLVLTLINGVKISLRGDPFLFSDIFLAGEAGGIVSNYKVRFTGVQIAGMVLTVVIIVALVLLTGRNRLKGHWPIRGAVAAGCAALFGVLLLTVYPQNDLYKTAYAGEGLISTRSDSQWYAAHGFTYAFLHSATERTAAEVVYDKEEMDAMAETLTEEIVDIPADKKVNLIMVQLEAYCDLTDYCDLETVEEAYAPLHEIEANAVHGDLIDNVFGGGTVDTERSVITGYTMLPEFTTQTNSYAWYLMSQGYTVQGSHPGYAWFYDRESINANLGFEHYYFSENYYEALVPAAGAPWHSDDVFLDEIVNLMENSEQPYFSLDISYQNHGPYESQFYNGDVTYFTADDVENEAARNILNNYVNLISMTNQEIAKMVNRLEEMEEPVVLVMFGDHKPYLGDGDVDGYEVLNINMDVSTDEGFMNTYSTPYFIWANSAAKTALEADMTGEGGTFGSCFLMNKVFSLCGWTGNAFMQMSNRLLERMQAVHSAVEVYYQDGVFVDSLYEEDQQALKAFLSFQKYWQTNFQYEDTAAQSAQRLEEEQAALEAALAEQQAQQSQQPVYQGGVTQSPPSENPGDTGGQNHQGSGAGGNPGGVVTPPHESAPTETTPAETTPPENPPQESTPAEGTPTETPSTPVETTPPAESQPPAETQPPVTEAPPAATAPPAVEPPPAPVEEPAAPVEAPAAQEEAGTE